MSPPDDDVPKMLDNGAGKAPAKSPAAPGGKAAGPGGDTGPGGVRHDARGNAVWHWAVETGKHAIDSTSRLLKRLEVPGLKLEDEAPQDPEAAALRVAEEAKAQRRAGYDPYGGRDQSAAVGKAGTPTATRKPGPVPSKPSAPTKPIAAPQSPGAAKPSVTTKPSATSTAAARPTMWQRLFRKD